MPRQERWTASAIKAHLKQLIATTDADDSCASRCRENCDDCLEACGPDDVKGVQRCGKAYRDCIKRCGGSQATLAALDAFLDRLGDDLG